MEKTEKDVLVCLHGKTRSMSLRHFFQSVYYLLYVRKLSQLVDFEESYLLRALTFLCRCLRDNS